MIPDLDPTTGHLPIGRYLASLDEVKEHFVDHPRFEGSERRPELWDGLLAWLALWSEIDERLGTTNLLHGLWMAGSFASSKPDPGDIDVTAFVDSPQLAAVEVGRPRRLLRAVTGHRAKVRDRFGLEVFTVPWHPVTRPLATTEQTRDEQAYLSRRGAYDDFWQRVRPPGAPGAPRKEDAPALRGYLELIT